MHVVPPLLLFGGCHMISLCDISNLHLALLGLYA